MSNVLISYSKSEYKTASIIANIYSLNSDVYFHERGNPFPILDNVKEYIFILSKYIRTDLLEEYLKDILLTTKDASITGIVSNDNIKIPLKLYRMFNIILTLEELSQSLLCNRHDNNTSLLSTKLTKTIQSQLYIEQYSNNIEMDDIDCEIEELSEEQRNTFFGVLLTVSEQEEFDNILLFPYKNCMFFEKVKNVGNHGDIYKQLTTSMIFFNSNFNDRLKSIQEDYLMSYVLLNSSLINRSKNELMSLFTKTLKREYKVVKSYNPEDGLTIEVEPHIYLSVNYDYSLLFISISSDTSYRLKEFNRTFEPITFVNNLINKMEEN